MIASLLSRRWFLILTVIAALIAALLAGTPFAIKHFARQWLLEHGGSEVQFRDVDFNPFSGTLLLEQLEVKVDTETTLSFASAGLDVAWLPLFRKQIEVQSVELVGFHIVVDNKDILRIGGIHLPQAQAESEDSDTTATTWLSGIDSLTLRDFRIVYRDPKIRTELLLERLLLSELTQWAPEQPAHLELSGSVNGAAVELNAELAPLAETASYRGNLSVRGLALEGFAGLVQAQLQQLAGAVTLDSDFSVRQHQGQLKLSHEGNASVADLNLASAGIQLQNRNLDWKGALELSQSAEGLQIAHDGGLAIAQLELVSDALQLTSQSGSWGGKLKLDQSPETLRLVHNGGVAIGQLNIVSDSGVIDNHSTNWDGAVNLELAGPEQRLTVQTDGALLLGRTAADLQQPRLYLEQEKFSHQGRFAFAQTEAGPALTASSEIGLEKLRLEAEERKFQLLDVAALRVSGLQIEALDRLAIDTVQVDELYLAPGAEPETGSGGQRQASLHIVQTRFNKPRYADRLLAIDSIEYEGYQTRLHRNKDGEWALVRVIDVIKGLAQGPAGDDAEPPAGEPVAAAGEPDAGTAEPLQFVIKRVEASGDSRLSFVDEAVKPAFKTELEFQQLKIENLDSRQPQQPSSLVLDGKIGKHTRVALQGDLRPFLQPPGLNLKGNINAMDLPQLSSYTRDGLGLLLNSGTLDADLAVKTEADTLDGKATLKLRQLQVKSVPGKDTLQSKIPVPLDTALDTLRDKNNTIQLEIPVSGNINDPQFSVNDAISQALAKGVQKGALSYLTLALQPYGTLITAAKYAGEAATRVRLNPVEFEPGQSQLDDSDREYLGKVAQVLKDRPKIAVKLCGVAAAQDQQFLAQQQQQAQQPAKPAAGQAAGSPAQTPPVDEAALSEIAEQRAAAIKDYLIEKHQVPASRLVGCLPQLELDDDKAAPRADLLI